jgi:adenosine deaminase
MTVSSTSTWYERVPKVELHLHLEGAIPQEALWQLIQKYGGDPDVPNIAALQQKFQYRDFPHFIETWVWKNQFLREYEDFTLIAEAVAQNLARQNVKYAEMFYSPLPFLQQGLETRKLTEAICTGLSRVTQVDVALIMDFSRDSGVADAENNLDTVKELKTLGVIGVGLGGSEQKYPPELYTKIYEKARSMGFHTGAHAGEAAGPESIWGAVRSLKVERIGHGTRAIEDESLMRYLAEKQIPLECCPLSNVRTGVVKSIEAHPVKKFFDAGLLVTVNTDDPAMFGNSLAQEYQILEERLGFSRDEIRKVILNGVKAAWLSNDRKKKLQETLVNDENWLK